MLEYTMTPKIGHQSEDQYRQMAQAALSRAKRSNPSLGEPEWFGWPLVIGQSLGWRVTASRANI